MISMTDHFIHIHFSIYTYEHKIYLKCTNFSNVYKFIYLKCFNNGMITNNNHSPSLSQYITLIWVVLVTNFIYIIIKFNIVR